MAWFVKQKPHAYFNIYYYYYHIGIEKIELLVDHFTVDISNTAQRLLDKYINHADSTILDY